jgi:tetratricopeptide (TPR) repeat protein/DNA-binding CsgD family transcriptional regulator
LQITDTLELISENSNKKCETIDNLNKLGLKYIDIDQEVALLYVKQVFELAKEVSYTKGLADSYKLWGHILYFKDEYYLAIEKYQAALELYTKEENDFEISEVYFYMSQANNLAANFEEAISLCQQSLNIKESLNDQKGISNCLNYLGTIHLGRKDEQLALQYYSKALSIKKELNDPTGMATVIDNMGMAYFNMGDKKKAMIYFLESLKLREELGDIRRIASSKQRIGMLYQDQGNFDSALEMFVSSLKIYEKLEEKLGIALCHLSIARLYNDMGNYSQALSETQKTIGLTKILNNKTILADIYQLLSNVFGNLNMHEEALESLRIYLLYHDSLFSDQRDQMIIDIEYKYQADKKDESIALLQSKNKIIKQKIMILTISIITLAILILLVFYLFWLKSRMVKQKNKLLENEILIRKQEMQLKAKERQLLEDQLELKNKDVAAKALVIHRTNKTLQHIGQELLSLHNKIDTNNTEAQEVLRNIIHNLEVYSKNNAWKEFDTAFKEVNNEFYNKLLNYSPNLTPSEIKLAALLKLNFSTKEIEAITFKSESGIKSTRYRLRQKLNLASDDNLIAFLMKL